jgi:hypothetical protein
MRKWWDWLVGQLEKYSRWSQLKALGNSGLVRASVLMPAFGYMLLLNENVHQYLTLKFDGWLLPYLPSVWRIWLLFYGTFLLAAATILYSIYCPREVKRYSTPFEMADGETEHQFNLGQFEMQQQLVRRLMDRRSAWETALLDLGHLELQRQRSTYVEPKAILSTLFMHHWHLRNIHGPRRRIALFMLFWTGLILIGIPAVLTFLQVTALGLSRVIF